MKIIRHILTERDNQTYCPVRIIAWLYSLFYLAASCVFLHDFLAHCKDWAMGAGAILGLWTGVVAKARLTEDKDA